MPSSSSLSDDEGSSRRANNASSSSRKASLWALSSREAHGSRLHDAWCRKASWISKASRSFFSRFSLSSSASSMLQNSSKYTSSRSSSLTCACGLSCDCIDGVAAVAKLSLFIHATRTLSDGHVDDVAATRSHEDAIVIHNTESRTAYSKMRSLICSCGNTRFMSLKMTSSSPASTVPPRSTSYLLKMI